MSHFSDLMMASGAAAGNQTLYQIISGLSLTSGLQICLDAGDSASYDPGVQTDKWLDTSGNGYDFYRGSGTGTDAGDPTFNGSAGGKSSSEYWSFDGADYLTYDSANETWMENLHKNNANFSILVAFYAIQDAANNQAVVSTRGALNGINLVIGSSDDTLSLQVFSSTGQITVARSSNAVNLNGWNVATISIDEAAGASGGAINLNGTSSTFDATYSGPGTGSTGVSMCIGRRPTGALYLKTGSFVGGVAMWEGTSLSTTSQANLWTDLRGRFGL